MKAHIVWNGDKTEGFVTTSPALAYEVRKSASTNCTTEEGRHSPVGEAFCESWYMDNCTREEIEVEEPTPEQLAEVKSIREHEANHQETEALSSRYLVVTNEDEDTYTGTSVQDVLRQYKEDGGTVKNIKHVFEMKDVTPFSREDWDSSFEITATRADVEEKSLPSWWSKDIGVD